MKSFSPLHARIVLLTIVLLLLSLIGRVLYLQTVGREMTIDRADRQHYQTLTLYARPGDIFDRNGLVLAGTIQTQSLFIDPKFMADSYQQDGKNLIEMDDAIRQLAQILDKDPFDLAQLLSDRSDSRFVKVAENLDATQARAITKLDLPGVGLQPTNERYYPMGSLAAHVLGGTMSDGTGLDGAELEFQKLLDGKNGWERPLRDARHHPIALAAEDYMPPQQGQQLILTIDANIQLIAEQELAAACEKYKAKKGEVVVMDPHTGEVLALGNWPTFDPQNHDAPPELRRDRALTDPFEPGSMIKPFIVGPALEAGVTRLTEIWPIPGIRYRTPYGRIITDVEYYGPLSLWDVLVKSSNIGMSMLGERLGNPHLHTIFSMWNFGKPTGIELPGESGGKLNPLRYWNKYTTESVSQGYELEVTPLQLVRGFCAYANGGKLVRPRLLRGVLDARGHLINEDTPPFGSAAPARQILDPQTVEEIRRVLCDVLVRGTATSARSSVYNIFGKTGTAYISDGKAGYSKTEFNSSFLGAAPAENPRLVVGVFIHDPDRELGHYGGTVSAPATRNILERSLEYLQVPPSPPLQPPPPAIAALLVHFDPSIYAKPAAHDQTADSRE
ncbi:MAG TPA: penicillin-binding protein 2 [Tepidisphaeraceae bacterium]|nr:penicillin-binding protein 2 [Tepidisphaeraceae bacterium]